MTTKEICLPNEEQAKALIMQAWEDFKEDARKADMHIEDDMMDGFIISCFVAGYCYGHNDTLDIIRDQMNVDNVLYNIFKKVKRQNKKKK